MKTFRLRGQLGVLWLLLEAGSALQGAAPCNFRVEVEGFVGQGTRIKCGIASDTESCSTMRYSQRTIVENSSKACSGGVTVDFHDTVVSSFPAARAPATPCAAGTDSHSGSRTVHDPELPGPDHQCVTTWNNVPSLPNFVMLCGLPSACSCTSGCTPSTTYQNPFSDADLKTAAVAAVTFPNAGQEQWTGSAVSGYTFVTNPEVSGTATKCIYRFKVYGTEAKQGYQIKWEVWEADSSGVRLYRRETAHFDGNGESVKIVSGGLLDVPSWGGAACQTPGSAIRFVRGESIKVIED